MTVEYARLHMSEVQPAWQYWSRICNEPNHPVKIQRCSDPHIWYAEKVGQIVPIVKVDRDGLWAREAAGHINIIRFEDVAP